MMNIEEYKDVHAAVSSCRDGRTLTGLQEILPHLTSQRIKECLAFLMNDGSITEVSIRRVPRYLKTNEFSFKE